MQQHREKPFSMVVGFKACHGPTRSARARPESLRRRQGTHGAEPERARHLSPRRPAAGPEGRSPTARTKINLNYFRCISAADDNLGRLLKTLDDLGVADDTVVVFASDNGYYNGEHRLGDKRSAYDESLRIPLLLRYPKLVSKGTTSDAIALNIDLAPTFLELAGVAAAA